MRYGSVCSGIEAATMAWHPLGWEPSFFSEIEAFPSAVLNHHYPSVPNLGDMTKFEEWPDHAIDLLVGGTPCQSFSVAGLRQGLADPRGNLMLTYLAIARRYQPRWLVWENVPGVLSSNGGRDFGTFIRGLEECGYHAAWRVLDAQFVRVDGFERAVPQRRRRVFVVGYLGDWRRAAAVLLEPEGMRGDSAPRRQAGQGFARDVAPSLRVQSNCSHRDDSDTYVAKPLLAGGHGNNPLDENLVSFPLTSGMSKSAARMPHEQGALLAVPFDTTQITSAANYSSPKPGAPCHPLAAGAHPPAIATQWAVRRLTPRECERLQGFPDDFTRIPRYAKRVPKEVLDETVSYIMRGNPDMTEAEAMRWASHPDGPRYKALGNSMAVNVMRWIGQRIQQVENLSEAA